METMNLPRRIVSFQYQVFEFEFIAYGMGELNEIGARGWELVQLVDAPNMPRTRRRGIFKRKVVTLPESPAPGTKRIPI